MSSVTRPTFAFRIGGTRNLPQQVHWTRPCPRSCAKGSTCRIKVGHQLPRADREGFSSWSVQRVGKQPEELTSTDELAWLLRVHSYHLAYTLSIAIGVLSCVEGCAPRAVAQVLRKTKENFRGQKFEMRCQHAIRRDLSFNAIACFIVLVWSRTIQVG